MIKNGLEVMDILLCNDDGLSAPGINRAKDILSKHATRLVTVAPDRQRSGDSHSITLSGPLTLEKVGLDTYKTNGTPADCIKLALSEVYKDKKPDICISGINPGANIVSAVHYSGTLAAAAEAALAGIPSAAISVDNHHPHNFVSAERFLDEILIPAFKRSEHSLFDWCFLNVNVPDLPRHRLRESE